MKHLSRTTLLASSLLLGLLAGCAVNSQNTGWRGVGRTYQSAVKPLPDGNYYVEAEAALFAGRQTGADAVATELATDYCTNRKQKMVVIKKDADSNFVVNGVSRLTFSCQ